MLFGQSTKYMDKQLQLGEGGINSTHDREKFKLCDDHSHVLKRERDSAPEASGADPVSHSIVSGLKTSRKRPKLQMKIEAGFITSHVEGLAANVCFEGNTKANYR